MSCLWYRREEATLRESVAFGNLGDGEGRYKYEYEYECVSGMIE